MSTWVLWWVGGQFVAPETAPSALDVLGELGNRFGLALSPWGQRVAQAWGQLAPLISVLGGLLWAATSERGQAPALLGWIAVMLASERLGYQPSVLIALAAMVGFILLAWLCSLANDRFVDRRSEVLPRDVLRAGVSAAALSAVVPLFAPGVFVFRLCRPYVATAPGAVSAGRGSSGGHTGLPEHPET